MEYADSLSPYDIDRLTADPTAVNRLEIVERLAAHYTREGARALSVQESAIADDIFRLLLSRAETRVRSMLAKCLCQSQKLPPDIARRMAADISDVSNPILERSDVLTDEDLLAIIGRSATSIEKLEAIARRRAVSENVSGALVETRIASVISTLVRNGGATISQQSFHKIAERHTDSADIVDALFQREALPVEVVEKVMTCVSTPLLRNLEEKYGTLIEKAEMRKALSQSLELTSLRMLGLDISDDELSRLATQLESSERFSPFFALCIGNLELFEVCMSRAVRVPLKQLHLQLQEAEGFRAAYGRADLPETMLEATCLLIATIRQLDKESIEKTGSRQICSSFQILDRMQRLAVGKTVDGIDYFYALLQYCTRKNLRF